MILNPDQLDLDHDQLVKVETDDTKESEVKDLIDQAVDRFGQLNNGFNMAGMNKSGLIPDQSLEDWQATQAVNLDGVFLATKYEGLEMKDKGGAIVNVASINAHIPMYYAASYVASKSGVELFTKNAALEFRDYDIRMNAILPGLIETPLTQKLYGVEELAEDFNETSLVVDGGFEITGYPNLAKYL